MVNLVSIKVLLSISKLLNIHTRSIDSTLSLSQANADAIIYIEHPFGFESPVEDDYVLLLIKNLYGLKQAAKTFYEHLVDIPVIIIGF